MKTVRTDQRRRNVCFGTSRTSDALRCMSAFGGKADMGRKSRNSGPLTLQPPP